MKSSHTGSLTNGTVVHALKRRVRIISPVLLKDPERACVLEIMLQKRDGIEKVQTVPDIASLVIYFDPSKLPKAKLLSLLDALLANLGKRKPAATVIHSTQSEPAEGDESLAEQEFNLTVDGMSCVSCATFNRDALETGSAYFLGECQLRVGNGLCDWSCQQRRLVCANRYNGLQGAQSG